MFRDQFSINFIMQMEKLKSKKRIEEKKTIIESERNSFEHYWIIFDKQQRKLIFNNR